jgi:hypothetical protein
MAEGQRFEHGSVLGGKAGVAWVNSQWKSTTYCFFGSMYFYFRWISIDNSALTDDFSLAWTTTKKANPI